MAFKHLDLADPRSIESLADLVGERFGAVDVLINNAAIGSGGGSAEVVELERWERVLKVNLTGTFLCSQMLGREMIARRRGKIINLASPCGLFGYPFSIAYNASKAGVWSLTQSLAVEWARFNVQVNAIVPGFVNTPMNRRAIEDPEALTLHRSLIPAGRISEPADLVGPALFLASGASDYVTGALLVVDGGMLAGGAEGVFMDLHLRRQSTAPRTA
jgi:NAD(P)-dependent dehydrogenase (short-subunit alcohol dehydrogenase family)